MQINPVYCQEILPKIFKNVFPRFTSLSSIFSVCKIWASQKEATWKEIHKYPEIIRNHILSEIFQKQSCYSNDKTIIQEYQQLSSPHFSSATSFFNKWSFDHPCEETLTWLLDDNQFEKAFAYSSSRPGNAGKVPEYLISKFGYEDALQLTLLFNEGENLNFACKDYLFFCTDNLNLFEQIKQNEEIVDEKTVLTIKNHPFIRSLKYLKNIKISDEFFELFNSECIIPILPYFSQFKFLFEILPDDYSFPDFGANSQIHEFFEDEIDHFKSQPLAWDLAWTIERKDTFIKAIQMIPHPNLRYITSYNFLDAFYLENPDMLEFWPHIHYIEKKLGLPDRATIELILQNPEYLIKKDFAFSQAAIELFKEKPDFLNDVLISEKEDEIYETVLELLISNSVPHYVVSAFIDSIENEEIKFMLKLLND